MKISGKNFGLLVAGLLTCILFLLLCGCTQDSQTKTETQFSGGSGTAEDPYRISSVEDLIVLSEKVNVEQWDAKIACADFILTCDIDMENQSWTPIGYFHTQSKPFYGSFNGDGHSVKNLRIDTVQEVPVKETMLSYGQGLFGYVKDGAVIKNLTIEDAEISYSGIVGTDTCVGAIAGVVDGTCKVTNCHASGTVSGEGASSFAGGLIGQNHGIVENCSASVNVLGLSSVENGDITVGGLIGKNSGEILNCYSDGTVAANGTSAAGVRVCAGGLLGRNEKYLTTDKTIVRACYAGGAVNADGEGIAGGLVGLNSSEINDCYAINAVILTRAGEIGGLVGDNDETSSQKGSIQNCYAAGSLRFSENSSIDAGSVVGWNIGIVKNCYYNTDSYMEIASTGNADKNDEAIITAKSSQEMGQEAFAELLNAKSTQGTLWRISNAAFGPIFKWQQ